MRLKTIICILMLGAAMHLQAQSISAIQGNPQVIFGTGPDDAKALSAMIEAIGSAYSNNMNPRMAASYSDEFRGGSSKIAEDGRTCRYITRSAVEDIFSARKTQAETIRANAMDAERNGDLGRAAMYHYWCIALFSSLPGDNRARVEEATARYRKLSGYKFPSTAASNISSKAELIFKITGRPAGASSVAKTDKKAEGKTVSPTAAPEALDTTPERIEINAHHLPLIAPELALNADNGAIGTIRILGRAASREASTGQVWDRSPTRHWACLLNIGATIWREPGIRIMGGALYNRSCGAYIAGAWNCKSAPYSYTFGKDGALDGGGTFWGDGCKQVSDWSATAGGIWMGGASNAIGAYAGLGYGRRLVTFKDVDGSYALDNYHRVSSAIGEAGVIGRIERFTMTTGVTFSRNYLQISAGVGYIF